MIGIRTHKTSAPLGGSTGAADSSEPRATLAERRKIAAARDQARLDAIGLPNRRLVMTVTPPMPQRVES